MSFKKVCKVCGREFHSAKYSSRYCSQNCYVKSRNWAKQTRHALDIQGDSKTLNEVIYNKVCPNCHKPFTAKKTNTIYCSPKCGKIYRKSKNEGLKDIKRRENYVQKIVDSSLPRRQLKIVKACANCGRDFDAMKITTMFCCSSCAKAYRIREKVSEDQGKITAESIYQKVAVRELNAPADSELLRPDSAAAYLGISRRTLYRYISQGIIKTKQMPGVTLIERSSLKEILLSEVSLRVKTKKKIEVPDKTVSPVFQGDRITIPEAAHEYGVALNVMQHYLRRSNLQFVKYRNTRFYLKKDVDKLVKKRLRERHPDITSWYSVDDIIKKYNILKPTLHGILYRNQVPKKKEGGYTYYSQTHIDDLLGYLIDTDKYYTTDYISEVLSISKRAASKLVQRLSLPKISRGGRIYIEKDAFDALLTSGKLH